MKGCKWLTLGSFPRSYPVFLGRTAQLLAIRSAQERGNIKRAWLPDYCCDTMIYPFLDAGVTTLEWYHIRWNGEEFLFEVDWDSFHPAEGDLVLWCDFFGFQPQLYQQLLERLKGGVLIHDITHSFLDPALCTEGDNYVVCSIRKWFSLTEGGVFWSKDSIPVPLEKGKGEYLSFKKEARRQKETFYRTGDLSCMEAYHRYAQQADSFAREEYGNRGMDEEISLAGIDLQEEISRRKAASARIQTLLWGEVRSEHYLFSIPLFLPEGVRDELLNMLQASQVRCAAFWEVSSWHEKINPLMGKNLAIDPSAHNLERLGQADVRQELNRILKKGDGR